MNEKTTINDAMACGCQLYFRQGMGRVEFCPLHKAAQKLLEALEARRRMFNTCKTEKELRDYISSANKENIPARYLLAHTMLCKDAEWELMVRGLVREAKRKMHGEG